MAANGLINKEKLRKTHLCFGNDFPRKISSYWRDYGPDTRIPCPLPSIGHRPQTPVEVRYIRYIKFFFWSQILCTYTSKNFKGNFVMCVLYRTCIYTCTYMYIYMYLVHFFLSCFDWFGCQPGIILYIDQRSIPKSYVNFLTFQFL